MVSSISNPRTAHDAHICRIVSPHCAQIRKLDGIEPVQNTLRQLWLSYNNLTSLSGIEKLTNLEVLKLIPWRETKYDGFPTARLLALTFFTTFFEDIPQAVLQVTFLIVNGGSPDAIAIISLGFSFVYLRYVHSSLAAINSCQVFLPFPLPSGSRAPSI